MKDKWQAIVGKLKAWRDYDWAKFVQTRQSVARLSTKMLAAIVLGVTLVILFYVAQNSQTVLYSRSVRLKQERLAQLQRQNAQLEADIAALTLPSTIEPRARALGLGPPKNILYADLPPFDSNMAQVLPAFEPQIQSVRTKTDWSIQLALWWESVKEQLGLSRNVNAHAAGE